MHRKAIAVGAILAMLSVVLGAFGAHALKAHLDANQLQTFEVGVRYQFFHSLAIIIGGLLYAHNPEKMLKTSVWMFGVGILLFSGSLYALTLSKADGAVGISGLGAITPFGGLCFILGWLLISITFLKKK